LSQLISAIFVSILCLYIVLYHPLDILFFEMVTIYPLMLVDGFLMELHACVDSF